MLYVMSDSDQSSVRVRLQSQNFLDRQSSRINDRKNAVQKIAQKIENNKNSKLNFFKNSKINLIIHNLQCQ